MSSEDWLSDVAHFLEALETFADVCCSKGVSRAYRQRFSANYRALFPSSGRHYRALILNACFERCPTMFVNGEKFEVDAYILQLGDEVLFALQQLHQDIDVLSDLKAHECELSASLEAFDVAWAKFEQAYIQKLMMVEDKARSLLARACRCEMVLHVYESKKHDLSCEDTGYIQLIEKLLQSLGKLNSVANVEGKGRDAFQTRVITRALRELETSKTYIHVAAKSAAQDLCNEVLQAFASIRRYLRAVASCLESVDPQLSHNEGLVARLVEWEESHDLGALFLQKSGTLQSLCSWVASAHEAKEVSPEMQSFCDTYDAELFLILPRVLWWCHLTAPKGNKLLTKLMAHRFLADAEPLRAEFASLSGMSREELLRHVVSGPGASSKGSALDAFLLELERLSMELQRTDPQEWNRCSHVVMRCLSGTLRTDRVCPRFHV